MNRIDELIKVIEDHKSKGFILECFGKGGVFGSYEVIDSDSDDKGIILYYESGNFGCHLYEISLKIPNRVELQLILQEKICEIPGDKNTGVSYHYRFKGRPNRPGEAPNLKVCQYWRFIETAKHKCDTLIIGHISVYDLKICTELIGVLLGTEQ